MERRFRLKREDTGDQFGTNETDGDNFGLCNDGLYSYFGDLNECKEIDLVLSDTDNPDAYSVRKDNSDHLQVKELDECVYTDDMLVDYVHKFAKEIGREYVYIYMEFPEEVEKEEVASEERHVVIVGNVVDGVYVVGPFIGDGESTPSELANEYGEYECSGMEWISASLTNIPDDYK